AKLVAQFAADLAKNGVEVFYAQALMPGDSLAETLSNAIERADFLLVVLTPAAMESPWVEQEWGSALNVEVSTGRTKVIPVMYLNCDPPAVLAKKFWADFRENYDSGFWQLLKALQRPQEVVPVKGQT